MTMMMMMMMMMMVVRHKVKDHEDGTIHRLWPVERGRRVNQGHNHLAVGAVVVENSVIVVGIVAVVDLLVANWVLESLEYLELRWLKTDP